ncbi:MAG: helix-turn-helix transcriptional regulator, partial [Bradyrhizobium sp.]|nr:helix-turn-helix transcriptional regulator [Bradyrhizobium sp.]
GARMRAAREGAGLSQVTLGERLGLPQSKVSSYERGEWMPRLDLAWRWSQACGCSVDALAG